MFLKSCTTTHSTEVFLKSGTGGLETCTTTHSTEVFLKSYTSGPETFYNHSSNKSVPEILHKWSHTSGPKTWCIPEILYKRSWNLVQPLIQISCCWNLVGEVGVSCAIFCFKVPSRRTIVFTCLRLFQVKIYKFGHIMCNSRLHGTAVEFTVGCRKKNLKWHNLPQPWGKLCHHKGQVVSICHVKKSLCKCSESKR